MWNLLDSSKDEKNKFSLELYNSKEHYMIRTNGYELMTTMHFRTENRIAEIAIQKLSQDLSPRVLIGGLGFGFTTRRVLQLGSDRAKVFVAEISEALINWSSGPLKNLMHDIIEDRRLKIICGDVRNVITSSKNEYDIIILDVDNGPEGLTAQKNNEIYSPVGLEQIRKALSPGGILAVWSGFESKTFKTNLINAGFFVEVYEEPVEECSKHLHYIYVGSN